MLLTLLLFLLEITDAFKAIDKLNGVCYVKEGDINIGVFNTLSKPGTDKYCSDALLEPTRTQYPEVTKYAIAEINNSTTLLPNISLGYVMIDTCTTDLVALARTLNFIADPAKSAEVQDGFDSARPNTTSPPEGAYVDNCSDGQTFYKVAGILGPWLSASSVMAAPLLRYDYLILINGESNS